MTAATKRFATPEPACCLVCRRHAYAIGHMSGRKVVWCCDNEYCLHLSKWVFGMNAGVLNKIERLALADAGNAAGQYLDKIGKTDLAKLDADEWRKFGETFIYAFEGAMRAHTLRRVTGEDRDSKGRD